MAKIKLSLAEVHQALKEFAAKHYDIVPGKSSIHIEWDLLDANVTGASVEIAKKE